MTGLEIGLILFVFAFLAFWICACFVRMGQLSQKIDEFQRALNKQIELNDAVQNGFVTMNNSVNDRFAAIAERLNTEGWRD